MKIQYSIAIDHDDDEEDDLRDLAHARLMSSQRCGNPDVIRHKEGRQKRYIIGSEGWKKREITYFVANWSPKLGEEAVVDEIQRAFDSWSGYSRLTFRHVRDNTADIIIAFGRSDHRDGYPFDGPGGILAHAFYPYEMGSFGGDIHFDDDEEWKINPGELEDGVDFFTVAVHELGHSLGLSHSPVSSSIMFPYYKGFQRNFQLDYDDILAMYQLYSAKLRAMTQIEALDEVEHQNNILPLQISSRASSQPLAAKIEVARTLEGDNQTKSETSNPDDNNGDGSDDNDENTGSRVDENVPTTERPLPTAEPQLPTTTTTGISFNGDDESVEDHIEHGAGSTASPIPDICEGNYDTVANLREELFFFKGKWFHTLILTITSSHLVSSGHGKSFHRKDLLWRREVSLKCKEVLYRAYFVPIVSYAAETWTVNVRETREAEAMGMMFVRNKLSAMKRNKIRN
uniref:Peptidase metallopeptidase domain-containing protein n=1 Tax=Timema shepardi TaxID=629360 RepID=A0A7R9AXJ0_TIMSH|nr:unnamed protein product [Timema shepardi]